MQRNIADDEDGYKGETVSLNTSFKQENFPIIRENYLLNASAPTDLQGEMLIYLQNIW